MKLSLYYFASCPFCIRVERVIDELGIEVERRNIRRDPEHLSDLMSARNRRTVPVLRITTDDSDVWMPESKDIIAYLRSTFG